MPLSTAASTKYLMTEAVFSVRAAVMPVTKTSFVSSIRFQSTISGVMSRNGVCSRS
jgi:hypothetical protein